MPWSSTMRWPNCCTSVALRLLLRELAQLHLLQAALGRLGRELHVLLRQLLSSLSELLLGDVLVLRQRRRRHQPDHRDPSQQVLQRHVLFSSSASDRRWPFAAENGRAPGEVPARARTPSALSNGPPPATLAPDERSSGTRERLAGCDLCARLASWAVRQVAYVPDAGHSRLIELCQADPAMRAVVLTTEEEGVALLAGAWLGGAARRAPDAEQRRRQLRQHAGAQPGRPLSAAGAHHHARRLGRAESVAAADGPEHARGPEARPA